MFLLKPKIKKQNDRLAIGECKWIGLYEVEQCVTHSIYLIRKVNTNLTQVVHRIRLRKYIPPTKPLDIVVNKDVKFETDQEFPDALEPQLMDAEKVNEEQRTNSNGQRNLYPHTDLDDIFTPVRYPFIERGRSEDKTEESPPQGKQTTQTKEKNIDDNVEWWREWDRMKEALNLETSRKTETTEKQRIRKPPNKKAHEQERIG